MKNKILIYQALVRLFGNGNSECVPGGSIEQNGCGKMSDFTEVALRSIQQLGCNYIWYTGLLQQASATDYSQYGIPRQNPQVLKGLAGSPYAISDYYSVSCDLSDNPARRMEEFQELVERTHKVGLKLIIDFVPNHVARFYKSVTRPEGVSDLGEGDIKEHHFNPQNNFYYCGEPLHLDNIWGNGERVECNGERAECKGESITCTEPYVENPAKATGNDVFHAWPGRNDWYETVKLNYGVDYLGGGRNCFDPMPDTWLKMRDILLYWAAKGVDGFRCDMAFMVPVDFWHWVIPQVKAVNPAIIFIAEIYEPAIYRSYIEYGGFDYLYDKVGLYDTLRAVVECRESASAITRVWQGLNGIQQHMLNFLENHDEQRLASDFFAGDPIKGRPALVVSALMNDCPFMTYFGQELGERGMDEEGYSGRDGRTTIFDYWSVPTIRKWRGKKGLWRRHQLPKQMQELREYYTKVFELANANEALREGAFYDLTYCNYDNPGYNIHRTFSFLRHTRSEVCLVVANFQGEEQEITVNIPQEAWEFVGVKAKRRHIENLMTGAWDFGLHDTSQPMVVRVPAYDAVVLRICGK